MIDRAMLIEFLAETPYERARREAHVSRHSRGLLNDPAASLADRGIAFLWLWSTATEGVRNYG